MVTTISSVLRRPLPTQALAGITSTSASSDALSMSRFLAGSPLLKQTFGSSARSAPPASSLRVVSVLDKSSGRSSSNSGDTDEEKEEQQWIDPARASLERLFEQAQRYEERLRDPAYADANELEGAVAELEGDLMSALGALRAKEEALSTAQATLLAGQADLDKARAEVEERERKLLLAAEEQAEGVREKEAMRARLVEREEEVVALRAKVTEREEELLRAKEEMAEKEVALAAARAAQLAEGERVLAAQAELRQKEKALREVEGVVDQLREQLATLEAVVARQEEEAGVARLEFEANSVLLAKTEDELRARVISFLAAREELQSLQTQLEAGGRAEASALQELAQSKALLVEVQEELKDSQSAVATFRDQLAAWDAKAKDMEREAQAARSLLRARETELAQVRREAARGKDAAGSARVALALAEEALAAQRRWTEEAETEAEKERQKVAAAAAEAAEMRREARLRDAELADAKLQLQLLEAALVGSKLEAGQAKVEHAAASAALQGRAAEIEAGEVAVIGLRRELAETRAALRAQEKRVASLVTAVEEREGQVEGLTTALGATQLRASEAESVVKQIAQLSQMLAESAAQAGLGSMLGTGGRADQTAVLSQANAELFEANRKLLTQEFELQRVQDREDRTSMEQHSLVAELSAVRESLQQREVEVDILRAELAQKDDALRRVIGRWDAREKELEAMRGEVVHGAEQIAELRQKAVEGGLPMSAFAASFGSPDGVEGNVEQELAISKLELDIAKVEAEAAIVALKSLADLSMELKRECEEGDFPCSVQTTHTYAQGEAAAATVHAANDSSTGQHHAQQRQESQLQQQMEAQLNEKDAALSMAKHAMDSLARLTRKLVVEAGLNEMEGAMV